MNKQNKIANFLQHLVTINVLDLKTAAQINDAAIIERIPIVTYLIKNNLLDATMLAQALAQYFNLPFTALEEYQEVSLPLATLNSHIITQYQILPLKQDSKNLLLAITDPTNTVAINAVKFHTALDLELTIVAYDKLSVLITQLLGAQQYGQLKKPNSEDIEIIKLVEQILSDAIIKNASDIHFEPYEKFYRIRFRIDGILYVITEIAPHLAARLNSRLKIIANLNIAERRLPQDGRFTLHLNQQKHDCRISTCPTLFGEKIVVRILNPSNLTLTLEQLNLTPPQETIFLNHIHVPQGMILVTGPTGSGKTVTLYTALSLLNALEKNISTVEDPVEISLPGINQVEVNHKIGLNFATTLRAFLRQDPDIIMVGEIRDLETAEIAIKAAQTGHLVLSTLHTNSAVEAITRLINMGVAPCNLATAVTLIIAQRLLRKLCPHCKTAENIATGCKHCERGYSGRRAIFELLPISKTLSRTIIQNSSAAVFTEQAQNEGMINLRALALTLVQQGITSLPEINRVIS